MTLKRAMDGTLKISTLQVNETSAGKRSRKQVRWPVTRWTVAFGFSNA
jgi:hypothetical protein